MSFSWLIMNKTDEIQSNEPILKRHSCVISFFEGKSMFDQSFWERGYILRDKCFFFFYSLFYVDTHFLFINLQIVLTMNINSYTS